MYIKDADNVNNALISRESINPIIPVYYVFLEHSGAFMTRHDTTNCYLGNMSLRDDPIVTVIAISQCASSRSHIQFVAVIMLQYFILIMREIFLITLAFKLHFYKAITRCVGTVALCLRLNFRSKTIF